MELTFKLLKNKKKEVAGFSLVAGGKAPAEELCKSIGDAIAKKGTAAIKVAAGEITFQGSRPYSVAIDQKTEIALKSLLADPKKLSLLPEPYYLGMGLRVVLAEQKDQVSQITDLAAV